MLTRRIRSAGPAFAGPALIVVCVLVVMRGFVVGGMLSRQHVDVLPMWLPTFGFLGHTLASGHIPVWNPFAMGGVPFAADPQSGWTYLPAMALFTAFRSDVAMRLFILAQPILAGLGVYGFLRGEGLGRAACTVGGLCLGLEIAHSFIALALPFAGTLAWTALLLASAARVIRARGWPGRFVWVAVVAVCWGQLANAHLSNGLVMGSAALAAYLAAALVRDVRHRTLRPRAAILLAVLTAGSLPLVNLAVLLPRLTYLPSTSIGAGYDRLDKWGIALTHTSTRGGVPGLAAQASWPSALSRAPGLYLGALAIVLSLAWWKSPRHRWLGAPLALYGFLFYLLSISPVARALAQPLAGTFMGQFYAHEPIRFIYATIFAVCVLAGLGADSLLGSRTLLEALAMLVPGVGLLAVLWWIAAPGQHETGLVVLGVVLGGAAIALCVRRRSFAWLLPGVVAIDMTLSGLIGQGSSYAGDYQPLRSPTVDAAAYVVPGPIATYLGGQMPAGGRYVTALPGLSQFGFQAWQRPADWAGLANQRSMLFQLPYAGGYNPAQLIRYWTLVRALDPKPMHYNAAFLWSPPPLALDLLGVRWVISEGPPPAWATLDPSTPQLPSAPLVADGSWGLYPIPGAPPPASVVGRWTAAGSPAAALRMIRASGFDPSAEVVLEGGPAAAATGLPASGSAAFEMEGTNAATVRTTASAPAVLLVRIPYERNWHAWVDGAPADVLPADYLDIGVPIPPGTHTVRLTYDDPTIGYGLLGTAVSLCALLGAALVLRRREISLTREDRSGLHGPQEPSDLGGE